LVNELVKRRKNEKSSAMGQKDFSSVSKYAAAKKKRTMKQFIQLHTYMHAIRVMHWALQKENVTWRR